jgi:hypothetical protein
MIVHHLNFLNMDKDKKDRSGSQTNKSGKNENPGDRRREHLPGSPASSNRNTGGSKRHERDNSSGGAERNTTKKGLNNI